MVHCSGLQVVPDQFSEPVPFVTDGRRAKQVGRGQAGNTHSILRDRSEKVKS